MPKKKSKFATNLKNIRLSRKLTLKQLGEILGCNHSYIYNIENGIRSPSPKKVEEIANKLGVELSALI